MEISVTVNGETRTGDVEPRTLLVYWLRDDLRLTGTNIGCDTSSCGACTVHVNGESVKSCTMLAVQADGEDILTIEGLAPSEDELHPMQEAFRQNHGLQCGYCTPGMVMAAVSLLEENPDPSEREEASAYLRARADRRREAAEDLVWAMLNSLEFVFNH